jgi:hypothetical protein
VYYFRLSDNKSYIGREWIFNLAGFQWAGSHRATRILILEKLGTESRFWRLSAFKVQFQSAKIALWKRDVKNRTRICFFA